MTAAAKWTDSYKFDKTDVHTKLFCAASDWMDRAKIAETRLEEALAALRAVLDALPVQHESFALRSAVLSARKIVARAIVGSYLDGGSQ